MQPLNVVTLVSAVANPDTANQYELDDKELPVQIPETRIVVCCQTNICYVMSMQRNRQPGQWNKSPYLTEFGSDSGSTVVLTPIFGRKHSFDFYIIILLEMIRTTTMKRDQQSFLYCSFLLSNSSLQRIDFTKRLLQGNVEIMREVGSVKKAFTPPGEVHVQVTHSMPSEKIEAFDSLREWAAQDLLVHLKPVDKCWQPTDFLPDPSSGGFDEQVKGLRERCEEIPDDYFVVLIGDTLPTYIRP